MKRILSLIATLIVAATVSFAQTQYSGTLNVRGEGVFASVINVTQNDILLNMYGNDDGTYKIELKNFSITLLDSEFNVGHIIIPSLTATADGSTINLRSTPEGTQNNIILTDGDDKDIEWVGSAIGGVQGEVTGTISGDNIAMNIPLNVTIGVMPVTLSIKYNGTVVQSSGINSVAGSAKEAPAYNIAGQPVQPSTRGVIIKGGRKYINR